MYLAAGLRIDMTGDWIEVLIFAGVAAFVAWRLISVLGTRTGHEPTAQPDGELFGGPSPVVVPKAGPALASMPAAPLILPDHWSQELKAKVAAVAAADSGFNPDSFLTGARIAYGLVLNSFWSGDKAVLKPLLADDVLADFVRAIDVRQGRADLGKRLVSIDSAEVIDAELEGAMAEVTVRFEARIEDAEGTKVERDIWSFSRHLRSDDPSWLLIATDND
jgi:predicted lipid-binding transport protein (Tim44 family)